MDEFEEFKSHERGLQISRRIHPKYRRKAFMGSCGSILVRCSKAGTAEESRIEEGH